MRTYEIILPWVMAATAAVTWAQKGSQVIRLDPSLDNIVSPEAKVEKLPGENFKALEGPVWVRKGGYLLFSDTAENVIYKWNPTDGKFSTFLSHAGFTGTDLTGQQRGSSGFFLIGSNGITLDLQGRVVFCAMGDRQVVRLEKDGKRTILAAQYEGNQLHTPNDLIYKSDQSLYFTDAPHVYLLKSGNLQSLISDLRGANGIAFAPGEKVLYIIDDPYPNMIIMRYDVRPDDTIANGRVFIDMGPDQGTGHPDGMKVDHEGNVYSTGPQGVWIMSPEGKHIGTIIVPADLTNLAFGDADGKALYMTGRRANPTVYRVRLKIAGRQP